MDIIGNESSETCKAEATSLSAAAMTTAERCSVRANAAQCVHVVICWESEQEN